MNIETTDITEFFAAATSNRFAPENNNTFFGVIAYLMGFVFPPEGFADDVTVIAESAAVDAGVTVEKMTAWLIANEDTIKKAYVALGSEHGPREMNDYEEFICARVENENITEEEAEKEYAAGFRRRQ